MAALSDGVWDDLVTGITEQAPIHVNDLPGYGPPGWPTGTPRTPTSSA